MLEAQKEHYDTAKELITIIKVLTQPEDIVKQYLDAADEMKLAGDYEDAKELEKSYRKQAAAAEAEGKEKLYLNAKNRMEKAQRDVDFILARHTFERVKGYKDADHLSEECTMRIESLKKKAVVRHWIVTIVMIAAAIAIVFGVIGNDHENEVENKETAVSKVIDVDNETFAETENI